VCARVNTTVYDNPDITITLTPLRERTVAVAHESWGSELPKVIIPGTRVYLMRVIVRVWYVLYYVYNRMYR
jgi:hypothetical protein